MGKRLIMLNFGSGYGIRTKTEDGRHKKKEDGKYFSN